MLPWPLSRLRLQEPDLALAEELDLSARTFCGKWLQPEEDVANETTGGRSMVRYVSCEACDRLHWSAS
jgi:hypothetical protein